jgi:hypothetical protein
MPTLSGLIEHVRRGDRCGPLFVAVIMIFMVVSRQAIYGFVEHDDYDWLLPPGEVQGYATPWQKIHEGGRWIDWVWFLFSRNLTPVLSSVLFILLLSIACWLAAGVMTKRPASALTALTLFFSPMLASVSLWPTVLAPSVMLMTVGFALFSINGSFWFNVAALAVCCYFVIFAYPPVAMVFVIVFAAGHVSASWKQLAIAALAVAASYALAVLTIFTINLLVHGYFGVVIEPWRRPRPLHSLADLRANIGTYLNLWRDLQTIMPIPLLASAAALLISLAWRETRRVGIVLVLAAAFAASVDVSISLSTGVFIPIRAVPWLWFAMCLPGATLLSQRSALLITLGAAALVLNLFPGATYWWQQYRRGAALVQADERLAFDIEGALALTGGSSVVMYGDPKADPRFNRSGGAKALQLSLWKRCGIRIEECTPEFCHRIEQAAPHTTVSIVDGRVVVLFPQRP